MPHVHFPTEPAEASPQDQKLDTISAELKLLRGFQLKCHLRTPRCQKQHAHFFYEFAIFTAGYRGFVAEFHSGARQQHETALVFSERLRKMMLLKRLFAEVQRDELENMRDKVPVEVWEQAVAAAARVIRAKTVGGDGIAGDEREGEGIFMEDAEMVEREDVNSEPVVEEQEQVEDDDQPQLDDSDYENLEVLESVTFVEFDGVLV